MDKDELLAAQMRREVRRNEIATELSEKNPSLGVIPLIIMSGDMAAAEEVDAAFRAGELTFQQAQIRLGSYARFDWVVKQLDAGALCAADVEYVFKNLPSLWAFSDPDDTNPRYLKLWQEAFARNDKRMLLGSEPFPFKRKKLITVYRGEPLPVTSMHGIAWSLDVGIARGFAKGAGLRIPSEGDVLQGTIHRQYILAYNNDRHEQEVILDPKDLFNRNTIERWRRSRK